ncbi:hypothetical protein JB92DRAFT_2768265 [Gautieria morchelliformis]|nr:hypothetical protein JB92DRAFT_2768265 [Gautieria morchelliformis]
MDELKVCAVRCHEDLCFKDGNVILVAEGICFRVHRGQLTRHSDVFRGMMSIPQPANAFSMDGCPIIVLHDRAQELAYMLKALYDGLYFADGVVVDFTVISAILRLSTKYFLGRLRRRASARLRPDWPSTLTEWDNRERVTPYGLYAAPILVIDLARELSLPSLLRAAFYDLSRCTPTRILQGSTVTPDGQRVFLSRTDLMLVFQGKEACQNFVSMVIPSELEGRRPTPWCLKVNDNESEVCRETFALVTYESMRAVSGLTSSRGDDPLFMLQCVIELQSRETGTSVAEKPAARGCEMCRDDLRATIQRARETIWDSIPGWFGINVMTLEDF